MTIRLKSKYKYCKTFKTDIWANIYLLKKRVKLRKVTKFGKMKKFRLKLINRLKLRLKKHQKFKFSKKQKIRGIKRKYKRKKLNKFSIKTRHGRNLASKQKLIKFYSNLKEYQFKRYLLNAKRNKKNILSNTLNNLEKRIDVVLYRSNLLNSILNSRNAILHKKIIRNNKIIDKPGYVTKLQDIIQFLNTKQLISNKKNIKNMWGYSSDYAYVNWKTLKLGIHNLPNSKVLNFPFQTNQRRILEFYKI